ncbi:MAG: acetoacetate decarboxylase, partial [Actinomycetota bacterium]|nr:acetoacetate decarboxylase [Actinomycetota bacterium]
SQNRWVREVTDAPAHGGGFPMPSFPNLEVAYLTDPAALAAALPPCFEPPDEPRVHARVTQIDLEFGDFKYHEMVAFFAVEAKYNGKTGEYPLLIPIDLESALSISREKFGEPKKLAEIKLEREGNHVSGSVTRNNVTFIEILGDIVETLPTPEPYPATQYWIKFLPAVDGPGFDAGPLLVQVDQVRTPTSVERVEGKLVLRDLPSDPVVDLPVLETEYIRFTERTSSHTPKLVGPIDAESFIPYMHTRYDR